MYSDFTSEDLLIVMVTSLKVLSSGHASLSQTTLNNLLNISFQLYSCYLIPHSHFSVSNSAVFTPICLLNGHI